MSNLLRSLIIAERIAQKNLSKILFFGKFLYIFFQKKTSDLLIPLFLMSDVSKLLRSLTKNERCEQSLRLLTKNE